MNPEPINWIDERLIDLRKQKAFWQSEFTNAKEKSEEKGSAGLALVHIGLHIDDLTRVNTPQQAELFT